MPKTEKQSPPLKTVGFIVLKGTQPCALLNVSGLRRGGVLLPGAGVVMFNKRRDARRAINRTERVIALVKGSMLEDFVRAKAPGLFDVYPLYDIKPLQKQ